VSYDKGGNFPVEVSKTTFSKESRSEVTLPQQIDIARRYASGKINASACTQRQSEVACGGT
jgi:hypothetical protein